jgi:hypothetical protein
MFCIIILNLSLKSKPNEICVGFPHHNSLYRVVAASRAISCLVRKNWYTLAFLYKNRVLASETLSANTLISDIKILSIYYGARLLRHNSCTQPNAYFALTAA